MYKHKNTSSINITADVITTSREIPFHSQLNATKVNKKRSEQEKA